MLKLIELFRERMTVENAVKIIQHHQKHPMSTIALDVEDYEMVLQARIIYRDHQNQLMWSI